MSTIDSALNGLLKLVIGVAVIGAGALAVIAVNDRLALGDRAAERRALIARNAELNASALAPGSMLACLDGGAGETIETACETSVFATPQSAAAAVAYTAARLTLLAEAFAQGGEPALEGFSAMRRALELDRYGTAAHVLAIRDGCTAVRCPAFTMLRDTAALKANLQAQAFDSYVARYAAAWNKTDAVAEKQQAAQAPVPVANAPSAEPSNQPVSSRYDFPSAASIPPVSIMNAEPPLPKEPAGNAAASPAAESAQPEAKLPLPPKRPQTQAATPPAQ